MEGAFQMDSAKAHTWVIFGAEVPKERSRQTSFERISELSCAGHLLIMCSSVHFLKSGHFCQGARLQIGFRERHHKNPRRQTMLFYVIFRESCQVKPKQVWFGCLVVY